MRLCLSGERIENIFSCTCIMQFNKLYMVVVVFGLLHGFSTVTSTSFFWINEECISEFWTAWKDLWEMLWLA